MSWGVNIIGKPAAVAAELDRVSAELQGESKAEFDAALPGLKSLVLENRVTEAGAAQGYVEPAVFLEASGHGTSGLSRVCSASVKSIYARIVAVLVAALCLAACTTPATGGGPSSAGAPQPATNLAQTARDQAAVPGQAYGGHNYLYFAAQGAAAVQQTILDIAKTEKWTAEQLTQALAATNGAPQNVTISVGGNLSGGDADNAGAGTGASGSAAGGGSIQRP